MKPKKTWFDDGADDSF